VADIPGQSAAVGRAPDNDIIIGDPATSGRHCRIEVRNGSYWISDLGSTNGTLVNGEPIIDKQLEHGDVISIGQNTIRFTLAEPRDSAFRSGFAEPEVNPSTSGTRPGSAVSPEEASL
jgi:pSer/pThr/pTyr-binding forkhead associated (FHA) protein